MSYELKNERKVKPMSVTDRQYVYADSTLFRERYLSDESKVGKWMLFYKNARVNSAWEKATDLFYSGQLNGIFAMKMGTNAYNARSSSDDEKALILYCCPWDDKKSILSYGRNVVQKMKYTRKEAEYGSYVYFKTDQQSMGGTRATGQKHNHLYKIPI